MTLLEDIEASLDNDDDVLEVLDAQLSAGDDDTGGDGDDEPRATWASMARPLLATGLASTGTALVVGGIFGSWVARIIGVVAVVIGTAWVYIARRSRNPATTQLLLFPVLLAVGFISLIGTTGGGPNELPRLLGDAIASGRLFRPPVPFDPGWRPLLVFLFGLLAFGTGSIAVLLGRPKLGIGITVPLTVLALISQPDDGAFIGGVFAFLPILAALAVLYGDDGARASELTRDFEAKRAVRGALGALVIVAALIALNSASFLFPDPVYDPDDKPQKPRAVPLSESRDRVLFQVETAETITGPWRIGALDVYDDDAFQSVASQSRLEALGPGGVFSDIRAGATQVQVRITIADLGDTAVMPMIAGTTKVTFASDVGARRDPRYDTLRVPTGRVPRGTVYTLELPPYATDEDLAAAKPGAKGEFAEQLAVPDPPTFVQDLLNQAPDNPWDRLDFLRQTLLDRVVASGAGTPTDVSIDRVNQILKPVPKTNDGEEGEGNEATPYEIVATEALLARWAGVPSRVGFGFDGLNTEGNTFTVRPRNSAQWLEVFFEGYGWVPLIGQPDQAKANLDDPNQRFTPSVEPSDEVAVQVYVLYEPRDFRLLYERLRDLLYIYGPWLALAALAYLLYPGGAKLLRARRRRVWAAQRGPLAQVMVEYAEMRDLAIDLNVGDDYDSPLEYLGKVEFDEEHQELAWLATQALYDDLHERLGPDDVRIAEELAESVRRRLGKAQPFQSRALAFISRASIEVPYTDELPNIRVIRLAPILTRALRRVTEPVGRLSRRAGTSIGRLIDVPRQLVLRRFTPEGGTT